MRCLYSPFDIKMFRIDKINNSACGGRCGHLLDEVGIFNPINWVFVKTSAVSLPLS